MNATSKERYLTMDIKTTPDVLQSNSNLQQLPDSYYNWIKKIWLLIFLIETREGFIF